MHYCRQYMDWAYAECCSGYKAVRTTSKRSIGPNPSGAFGPREPLGSCRSIAQCWGALCGKVWALTLCLNSDRASLNLTAIFKRPVIVIVYWASCDNILVAERLHIDCHRRDGVANVPALSSFSFLSHFDLKLKFSNSLHCLKMFFVQNNAFLVKVNKKYANLRS